MEDCGHESICALAPHAQSETPPPPGTTDKGEPQGGPSAPCGDVPGGH